MLQNKILKVLVLGLLSISIPFGETNAAIQTGIKIDKIKFDEDKKVIIITVCNWDKNNKDMGDYKLIVSNGTKKVTKTFPKNYIINYACAQSRLTPEALEISQSASFNIRTRLESTTGKQEDEKSVSLYTQLKKRFKVPDEPLVDIVIQSLTFDESTKMVIAKICNQGENYRISPKYSMSTLFSYNNYRTKKLFKEKELSAGQCWAHRIELRQLKLFRPGTYTVEVLADAGNAIEEKTSNKYDTSREENNRKTIEVTIPQIKPTTQKIKKTIKPKSSMTLWERIAAMRSKKNSHTISNHFSPKRKTSARRSRNYKTNSSLRSKYPYLFR